MEDGPEGTVTTHFIEEIFAPEKRRIKRIKSVLIWKLPIVESYCFTYQPQYPT